MLALIVASIVAVAVPSDAVSPDVVISEVYTAGGTASPTFANDFIELYNSSAAPVSVAGWSVQYASATGTTWAITPLTGTIPAQGYYLVRGAAGGGGTILPTPDATGTLALATGSGKVALVTNQTALTCGGSVGSCSAVPTVRDLLGYGTVSDREVLAVATLTVSVSAQRTVADGTIDTDNNRNDFITALPTPRNSLPIPKVVISEIYGGGGSLGAYNRDFVELYNDSDSPADITGYSIQYTSASGTAWTPTALVGTIPARGYYLVGLGPVGSGSPPLPAPVGASNTAINLAVTAGKVALFIDASRLTCTSACASASGVLDFVGYGAANDSETTPTLPTTQTLSAQRSIGDGTVDTDNNRFDFVVAEPTPNTAAPVALTIPQIQGAGHTSPYVGQVVTRVAGVVTALAVDRFWYQDRAGDGSIATSDGIMVRSVPTGLAVGDLVSVDATVVENQPGVPADKNLTVTELRSATVTRIGATTPITTTVIGPGGRVPPTTVIDDDGLGNFDPTTDGIDFYESLEGMLVSILDAQVVGPTNGAGQIVVVPVGSTPRTPRGGMLLTPGDLNPERVVIDGSLLGTTMPPANVADTLAGSVAGPMDYANAEYLLLVTTRPTVTSGGLTPEITAPELPGQLTTATYNARNLSAVDAQTRFDRTAAIIVTNLQSPDILSVEEIQDNNGSEATGGVDATQTIARLIDAITAAGGPAYSVVQIDPESDADGGVVGANIRNIMLYRTDRGLSLVSTPGGDATTATSVTTARGGSLSLSPGRVAPGDPAFVGSRKPLAAQFVYNGQTLFVVSTHFSSKTGDDPAYGVVQPPSQPTEATRIAQGAAVSAFVDQVLAVDPTANVVVLGTVNDFPTSAAAAALQGSSLTNLLTTLPPDEQYSYIFQGNSQSLSTILASAAMSDRLVSYDSVHVNAEFADQSSDHDPQIATFALAPESPDLTITKSAVPSTVSAVGDTVTYEFLVTNQGNVIIDGISVSDFDFTGAGVPVTADCTGQPTLLRPTESITCIATYAITQEDIDAGNVDNSAIANGVLLDGREVQSSPSTASVSAEQTSALTLVKSADPVSVGAAGESVQYSFLIANDGNTTLSGVEVQESDFSGSGPVPTAVCGAGAVVLAPSQSVTCTASYVVTQLDIDSGSVDNTAMAVASAPDGSSVESDFSNAVISAAAAPELTLVKSVSPTEASSAGDQVEFSFLVTNTGNVSVTAVGIVEGAFTGTGGAPSVSCPDVSVSLAPDDAVTCSATYTLTQQDIDNGGISNSATATGNAPAGAVSSASSTASVSADVSPALSLTKSVDPQSAGQQGAVVTYSFVVKNTGNVTVNDVVIREDSFTGSGIAPTVSCPAGAAVLAPDTQITCTSSYVITQSDIDNGVVSNTATASGAAAGDSVNSEASTAVVSTEPAPSLTFAKTADRTTVQAVGDTINYAFTVTNSGNVTLTDLAVTEVDFSGAGPVPQVVCPDSAAALAPSAQLQCTAAYTVTAADLDSAVISNTARAAGMWNLSEVSSAESTATVTVLDEVVIVVPPPVVSGPGEVLAATGTAEVGPIATSGIALLLAGVLLLLAGYRRQRS